MSEAQPRLEARRGLRRLFVDLTPIRASADYRRLWIGQTLSFVLGEVTYVALPFQVYELTKSTFAVGAIAVVELVPLLSLTLLGGAAADALDRRRLLVWTEAGTAASVAGLVVNAALPHPRVALCFVFAFFAAAFSSFGAGAVRSLIPRLVPPEHIPAALALNTLYGNVGAVLGPALGGVLIATIGLTGAYAVGVAGFLASLTAFWLLPSIVPIDGGDPVGIRSVIAGFRYLRRQRVVLGCFVIDTIAMVFGMPSSLFPAIALSRFHAGGFVVGLLYASPGIGALVASVLSGWIAHVRRQGVGIVIAAALWGVAITAFGFATALPLAVILLAAAGCADAFSAVMRGTITFATTPDAFQGRVSAAYLAQVTSAPRLGNLEAGGVASLTSVRFSIVSGGIACVAGCIALVLFIPALIRYDSRAPT
ncbi:MAG TPA: MFS transporter [Gaiellaceae bacterium]|nr:MFS transporter [Gaiellaceae bacterium]